MRISTKGRYGLRLIIDLGLCYNEKLLSLKEIAQRQDISEKYLEQIITPLNRAGYVSSVRGAKGGYRLAVPPEELTVGMVLRELEGTLLPVDCLGEETCTCNRIDTCATISVWRQIKEAVDQVVDHITIASLLPGAREKEALAAEKSAEDASL